MVVDSPWELMLSGCNFFHNSKGLTRSTRSTPLVTTGLFWSCLNSPRVSHKEKPRLASQGDQAPATWCPVTRWISFIWMSGTDSWLKHLYSKRLFCLSTVEPLRVYSIQKQARKHEVAWESSNKRCHRPTLSVPVFAPLRHFFALPTEVPPNPSQVTNPFQLLASWWCTFVFSLTDLDFQLLT